MTTMTQMQLDKYKKCLMNVNIDLGILIQNAENLAYKLGAIKAKDFKYKAYDYYNQYDIKDIMTLRKNILSSLKFLKAQFSAIKEDAGKEYIYPPSIDKIKTDIKKWMGVIGKINPDDVKYYKAILEILENKKYNNIKGSKEVYKICKENKKSDLNPYMWMYISPPILSHIDKNNKENEQKAEADANSMPDLALDENDKNKINIGLISSNDYYVEQREINELLRNYKEQDYEQLALKVNNYIDKYKQLPYIEKENEIIFDQILKDNT